MAKTNPRKRLREAPSSPPTRVLPFRATRQRSSSPCPAPKRARIILEPLDDESNKENLPPADTLDSSPAVRQTRGRRYEASLPETRRPGGRKLLLSSPSPTPSASVEPTEPAETLEAMDKLSLASSIPTPPPTPQTEHARARALLRASAVSSFIGRETERAAIQEFLDAFCSGIASNERTSLYISGAPGSGKTALVQDILNNAQVADNTLKVVFVNCMGMAETGLLGVQQRLLEELQPRQRVSKKGIEESLKAAMKSAGIKCLLVLDEIDHLCSDASLFTSLLNLSQIHSESLRIVGIANTHTLTSNPTAADGFATTLHFAPYTAPQLMSILAAKLSPLTAERPTFIPPATLLLLSRKIASTSGDVRALLSTLLRAVDSSAAAKAPTVTPAHILDAIKRDKGNTPSASDFINKVQELGLQARLVLCIFVLASKRMNAGLSLSSAAQQHVTKGKENTLARCSAGLNHTTLHTYYTALLKASPISSVSRSEFSDILANLEVNGFILLSLSQPKGREKSKASITLASGVRRDEILRGLFKEEGTKHDEVKAIWDAESTRITRMTALASS